MQRCAACGTYAEEYLARCLRCNAEFAKEIEMMKLCQKCKIYHEDHKFCPHCGWEQSKDPADAPFCVVEIPNAETAAWMRALIGSGEWADVVECSVRFNRFFPGGVRAAKECWDGKLNGSVTRQLHDALEAAGITPDSAPWLKPKVPKKVGCLNVVKTDVGYAFVGGGSANYHLTWGELEAMLAEKPK